MITKQDETHTPISLRESSPIAEYVALKFFTKASISRWSVRNSWDIAEDWSFVSSSAYEESLRAIGKNMGMTDEQ